MPRHKTQPRASNANINYLSERPLKRSDWEARAYQAPSGPWAKAQRLRRPAAPTRLRARGVSAPANGRDERCGIGLVAFAESHWVSLCRDADLSADKQMPEINPR